MGSGGMTPFILNLSNIRRCVVSYTPRPLYSQGSIQKQIKEVAGWAPEPVRTFREKTFSFLLVSITFDCAACRLVTALIELRRLLQFTECYRIKMGRKFWCRYRDNCLTWCHAGRYRDKCVLPVLSRDRTIQSTTYHCDLIGFILI